MAISEQLTEAIKTEVGNAYADGWADAVQALRDARAPMRSTDEVGEADGYDQTYLDGLDDAINTLDPVQAEDTDVA